MFFYGFNLYKRCCKEKFPEPCRMPPTSDELRQYVKRANYQAFIWKKALEIDPKIPDPERHGWELVDGKLRVLWMKNKVAPEEILELLVCKCKRKKCLEECQCVQLKIPCTDICKCKNFCDNQQKFEASSDVEFDED